jgi:hypothetical protein
MMEFSSSDDSHTCHGLHPMVVLSVLVLCLGTNRLPAAEPARITIQTDQVRFRLQPEIIGANMEDLHYQMVGGFDSQLIHGESFFEPSPTDLAQTSGHVDGFTSVSGTWRALPGGSLRVDPKGGKIEDLDSVPVEAGAGGKSIGARLTSDAPADQRVAETAAEFWFPADAKGSAGLILHVHPNHSDNGWEWYSGYTLNLRPHEQEVALTRAVSANKHVEIGKITANIAKGAWTAVAVRIASGNIMVHVNGKEVLRVTEPGQLPVGHFGLVASENIICRNFALNNAAGKTLKLPFQAGTLVAKPGDAVSLRWAALRTGNAKGTFELLKPGNGTWLSSSRSQKIIFTGGTGEIGVDNAGLKRWGLSLRKGKSYEGFLRVKTTRPTTFDISLRSADGKIIHAHHTLQTAGKGDFEKLPFSLAPAADDPNGRFAVTLSHPGEITLGYAFLQPGDWGRFKNLPIRKDLADALVDQGIKLLRLNGGMIEVGGYRWANMQGPRDTRPPFDGFYDRYCSSGYGPIEHLNFCEAAGFTPVIGLNLDETPESVADFIAYCNAPANTPTGRRRAADGHPAPYRMKYYQVANESKLDAAYVEKFKRVAEAAWTVDPAITLIPVGHGYSFSGNEPLEELRPKLTHHLALTQFVKERGRKILWDHHAFYTSDNPAASYHGAIPGAAAFARVLAKLDPSLGELPMGVFEFNAGRFNYNRGLAHAVELNQACRFGDRIVAGAMPNVSQPWDIYQTDWKAVLWTQGNIYYTQDKVWFQPAYYVQQMITRAWAPDVVESNVAAPAKTLDVLAAKTADGKRLVLRVVNLTSSSVEAALDLNGFSPRKDSAEIEVLAHDDPMGFNTREQPEKIKPARSVWNHGGAPTRWSFPPTSFSVIILE